MYQIVSARSTIVRGRAPAWGGVGGRTNRGCTSEHHEWYSAIKGLISQQPTTEPVPALYVEGGFRRSPKSATQPSKTSLLAVGQLAVHLGNVGYNFRIQQVREGCNIYRILVAEKNKIQDATVTSG